MPLLGMETVRELVHTVLLTGRVMGEKPQSLLLVAEPESGKTSIVLEQGVSCAVDFTDVTGRGLQEILKWKPDITHVIFNDLTAIFAHGKTVRAYLLATINAMVEEGVRAVAFPGKVEVYEGSTGIRGIIACLTPKLLADGRQWWNKVGLTTRMIPFNFKHSSALILRIKQAIDHEDKSESHSILKVPKISVAVKILAAETNLIRALADQKSKELKDETGYRRLKQFRVLAKAHALKRNWKNATVTNDDVNFLRRIFPYISYEKATEI